MKLSVIIPAYNEEKLLGQTLSRIFESGAALEQSGWEWEVVVCDNNSTDGTAEIARSHGARVVFERENQIGRARNTGAAAASGEWLLFIDADSRPDVGLFRELVRCIDSGDCIGGGAAVKLDESHRAGEIVTWLWNRLSRSMRWAAGSFLFCRADCFWEIGGFDLSLYAGEEIDLSQKLKRQGRFTRRRMIIIGDPPLETSARKLKSYSSLELLGVFIRFGLAPQKRKRREACGFWYEGRR